MKDFRHLVVALLLAVQACNSPPVPQNDPATVTRLQKITIAEVEFKDTAVSDVLEFFHFSSLPIGYKPPAMRQEADRTEVTYFIPIPDLHDPQVTPPDTQTQTEGANLPVRGPLVTLTAKGVSLLELLQRVATDAKGTMIIRPDLVIIRIPLTPDGGHRGHVSTRNNMDLRLLGECD